MQNKSVRGWVLTIILGQSRNRPSEETYKFGDIARNAGARVSPEQFLFLETFFERNLEQTYILTSDVARIC